MTTQLPPATRMRLCLEDVLRERVPLFDGLDALMRVAEEVPDLADDRDLRRIAEILAQAEHLPVGAARARWSAAAVARHDAELMEIERRNREAAHYCCRRLGETLDGLTG
jgi:hypothetical protein